MDRASLYDDIETILSPLNDVYSGRQGMMNTCGSVKGSIFEKLLYIIRHGIHNKYTSIASLYTYMKCPASSCPAAGGPSRRGTRQWHPDHARPADR